MFRRTKVGLFTLVSVLFLLDSADIVGPSATVLAARGLTLQQALELAGQHSPVLKASQHDVQSAEEQRTIAGAAYLPRVEATETWTNTNNPTQVFGTLLNQGRFTQAGFDINHLNRPSPIENYRLQLSLIQPVYNGGRERLSLAMAEIGQAASQEGFQSTRQRVLFSVTRTYYDLVLAKALLTVARQTTQIAEANLKQIQSRYSGGATVKSDLLQAEVRLASLREEAIRADQAVRVAGIALRHAIGLDEPVDAVEALSAEEARQVDLEAAVAKALEGRPDFRMLSAEHHKAEVGIQLARSAYLPTFNLQTSYELNNTAPFSPNGSNNYVALGVISLNLFNGMSDAAQVRKARAQEEKARQTLEAKRREIEVEVVEAYYGHAAARERIAVSEGAVAQAEENLRIVRNRYTSGLATVIDLLTAELVLNQAKHNRMRALYDERIGRSRLELVTGQFGKVAG
jgi:TolC family type I secretion outer membrane protein